jgi:hypothetical protein
VVVEWVGLH